MQLSAVVSKPCGKFATADNTSYYIGTLLVDTHENPAFDCMRIKLKQTLLGVQELSRLADFEHHRHFCRQISKSIYGLPQAGRQAHQDRLVKHLKASEYIQCTNTSSLFSYKPFPTSRSLSQ